MRALVLFALFLTLPSFAHAQYRDPVFELNEDDSLLHISATEQREVDQDLLIANLRFEIEDKSNKVVQNEINKAMADALKLAKSYSDVKAVTRSYNVHQYDKNRSKVSRTPDMFWKGSQTVELKSKNADDVLELAGKIQERGFVISGLNYTLSPEVAAKIQDEMLEAALEKLQNRAERAAKALGKKTSILKEINTQGNYAPRPVARAWEGKAMASSMEMAAPVASPGETTLTMTVNAKAFLR